MAQRSRPDAIASAFPAGNDVSIRAGSAPAGIFVREMGEKIEQRQALEDRSGIVSPVATKVLLV